MSPDTSPTHADWISPARIGIVGFGIVGQALAFGFSQKDIASKYTIKYHDKYKESPSLEEVVRDSEFIFICLPTPMKQDESGIDLSILDEMIDQTTKFTNGTDKIIVIKSTIVPGTTKKFESKYPKSNFAFNPEFLTEANYLADFINADRTVVGANNDLTSRKVIALFRQRFPTQKIFQTDTTTAEMIKYMANAFLATKVMFANEMFDICNSLGVKYEEVKSMAAADRRIGDSHLNVTTARGFGGKCLPKDLVALIGSAKDLKIEPKLLRTVWALNKEVRKVHDWEEIPFAVTKVQKKSA